MELFREDGCLSDEGLHALTAGQLDELGRLEAAEHLSYCDECMDRYTALLTADVLEEPPRSARGAVMGTIWVRLMQNTWGRAAVAAVAAVLALELVNSAIERAVDKPDTTHWWTAGAAKDMAAGAVLVMAIGTVVVAVCLFWPRLDILWAVFTARPTRPLWLLLTLIVFYKFIFRSSNSTEKGKQANGKSDS